MSILPFLSAAFLLINPVLLLLFRRLDINLEKLQFWVMVTSGTAWILSLLNLFLTPETQLNPIWDEGFELLPSLAFSLDWISNSLLVGLTAVIFFAVLKQQESPQANAWLTGVGGICGIGLFSDSAYAFALAWTSIEFLRLIRTLRNQKAASSNARLILGILFRQVVPLLLIYASLLSAGAGEPLTLTEMDSASGFQVLTAGMIGFFGWIFFSREESEIQQVITPEIMIPAMLGVMLIIRASTIINLDMAGHIFPILLAILLLLISIFGLLFNKPDLVLVIGCAGLMLGSALILNPEAVLSWGLILFLPGLLLVGDKSTKSHTLLAVILGVVGSLPLPYFPAWTGVEVFGNGIIGLIFAIAAGLFLGLSFFKSMKTWQENRQDLKLGSPLLVVGSTMLILSQFIVVYKLGLFQFSTNFLSLSVLVWIAAPITILLSIFREKIPSLKGESWEKIIKEGINISTGLVKSISLFMDRIVYLVTRLFEGDGGLIWALLIGFLIITLISMGRGQ
ncbi:MAG: hypothetical protein HQ574_04720 [Chloroflexi bacterium]|nr:hypothetical protein [Chloroflexota bacterium]